MGKYFSEETGRRLRAAGRFGLHFVPGYSSYRSIRFLDDVARWRHRTGKTLIEAKEYTKFLVASVGFDIAGSAIIIYSALTGFVPGIFLGATPKIFPATLESGVRYIWERDGTNKSSAGGEGGSAQPETPISGVPAYLKEADAPHKEKLEGAYA